MKSLWNIESGLSGSFHRGVVNEPDINPIIYSVDIHTQHI